MTQEFSARNPSEEQLHSIPSRIESGLGVDKTKAIGKSQNDEKRNRNWYWNSIDGDKSSYSNESIFFHPQEEEYEYTTEPATAKSNSDPG